MKKYFENMDLYLRGTKEAWGWMFTLAPRIIPTSVIVRNMEGRILGLLMIPLVAKFTDFLQEPSATFVYDNALLLSIIVVGYILTTSMGTILGPARYYAQELFDFRLELVEIAMRKWLPLSFYADPKNNEKDRRRTDILFVSRIPETQTGLVTATLAATVALASIAHLETILLAPIALICFIIFSSRVFSERANYEDDLDSRENREKSSTYNWYLRDEQRIFQIRSTGLYERVFALHKAISLDLFAIERKQYLRSEIVGVIMGTGTMLTKIGILAFLLVKLTQGTLSGELGAAFYAAAFFLDQVSRITYDLSRIPVDADKVARYYDMYDYAMQCRDDDAQKKVFSDTGPMQVAFQNVSYKYPGQGENEPPALDNISFVIKPREKVGIVGENGAGKSTVFNLLTGEFTPNSGTILINGVDISTYSRSSLQMRMGIYFSKFKILYAVKLREFLDPQGTLSDEEILGATESVGLREKLEYLTMGLDAMIGNEFRGGVEFSDGQTQRLILGGLTLQGKTKGLIITDELTSGVDPKGELSIQHLFANSATTSIHITHKMPLAGAFERIMVIKDGRIIEDVRSDTNIEDSPELQSMFIAQQVVRTS